MYISLTSLLTHNVAYSTRHSFRPKINNQALKKFLSLAVSWIKVVKNWTSLQKIKWFKKWSFQKMSITKSVPLKSYSSMKKKIRKIRIILALEIVFESQNFAHFDYFYSSDHKTWIFFNGLVVGFGPKGRPGIIWDSMR